MPRKSFLRLSLNFIKVKVDEVNGEILMDLATSGIGFGGRIGTCGREMRPSEKSASMSDSQLLTIPELKAQVHAVVQAAEDAWKSHVPARMVEALQACERTLQALPAEKVVEGTEAPDPTDAFAQERWALWLWRGRLLILADQPDVVVKGLQSLDQAIGRLQLAGDGANINAALAIAWMNRGSGLFRLGAQDALGEAVRSYDQVIGVLSKATDPDRNTLGAAWMNRGVGLMHLEDATETKEALDARLGGAAAAFTQAIAQLEPLVSAQPAARRNLASVWANLGLLRTRLNEPAAALEAHQKGVELFHPLAATGDKAAVFELAARLFNLGQAAGATGDTQRALNAGRESLALTTKMGVADAQAGELALRARHAVCVVLGGMLAAAGKDSPERAERLSEAGDLVEDGLAALTARGASATDGEHFLGEYLLEHLGDDAVRAKIAAAAVQTARQGFVQRNFNDTSHGDMDRVLDVLQELGQVETRLKELGVTA
jgi:tetratricopeptide (TPR) repeat protein